MALTPEDVIGKTFLPTRFQEGYNQDEVDDFLDEVVATLRGLQQENDELRAKLASCESKCAELASEAQAPRTNVIDLDKGVKDAPVPAAPVAPAPAPAPVAAPAAAAAPLLGSEDASSSAAGVLALAQRLHDEHVAAGQKQRDQMIAEAQERADALVGEAEQVRTNTLSSLEMERDQLQAWIDSLRDFEHEYRSRLKSFLQAQLGDLETQASLEPEHSGT